MVRSIGTMVVGLALFVGVSSRTQAQQVDSAPKFSVFGGVAGDGIGTTRNNLGASNFELGGSADFRLRQFPLTLRATLAFSQQHRDYYLNDRKGGQLSLDVVGHPVPSFLGIRPYLLGGLGVATQAEYASVYFSSASYTYTGLVRTPRQTWAFLESGVGLELGRHLFIQSKLQLPVASNGPTRTPLSIGIRF